MAFVLAALGFLLHQRLTMENRARQLMKPYAQLISVGTDVAVAFEDPVRAQEILDTFIANPQILSADIYLHDGSLLASYEHTPDSVPPPPLDKPDGVYFSQDMAEMLQSLPSGARLRLSIGLDQLKEQTRQAMWLVGIGMAVLLAATFAQLIVLRRTIVRPIAALTLATEQARKAGEYQHRVPASGTDEVASLGRNFNAMMEAIQEREDNLCHLNAFQRTILDNAAHGIISMAPDGIITSFNPAAERLLGYSAEEVVGKLTPIVWHDAAELADYAEKLSGEFNTTVEPGFDMFTTRLMLDLPEEREWTFICKNGKRRPAYLSVTALRDENGEVTGFLGMAYDLTERKQAEKTLHQLNRELRAISECNQILVRAEDEQSLLNDICRIICEDAGYHMAWVGYAVHDEHNTLLPVAWYGTRTDFLTQTRLSWADTQWGSGTSGTAVRTGQISSVNDLANDADATPWHTLILQQGNYSCISLPLKNESDTFGVLSIYSSEINVFTQQEERLLEELAGDLAFGIVSLRARIEHNRAEEQIRIAATAFEAQEGIIITNAEQKILRVNCAFSEITGYQPEEVIGRKPGLLKSGRHELAYYQKMWETILRDNAWQGEVWNKRKNGEIYPVWLNITAVKNPEGEVTHYVGTMIDITERKAAAAKIEHLAFHDPLTLLPNRRLLLNRLDQALTASVRTRQRGALLFIDLDNFKILNDTLGHDAGDQLLIEVAKRLTICVRKEDTIARFGGDEFMIMLTDLGKTVEAAAEQAGLVGEKILYALNQPYTIAGHIHHITPSLGITLFHDMECTLDDLMKQADIAMYQAKSRGRNTIQFFDPAMQSAVTERAATEMALRRGIEERQFILHYQPQVNVHGIVGAEALLRWNHPERGIVAPAGFIPLAEETGLILPIGQWVLESVCQLLREWMDDPFTCHLRLAVNVSPLQFRHADFVDQVRHALEKYGAPASQLKIELTESLLIEDIKGATEKMHALKALGVGFSLDDFGTGYSSLSYLTQLPLEQLKIDQSFIQNLPDNHNDAVVVQTIITMAKSLKLAVIAEGVETLSQRQILEQYGCTVYQGDFFGRPISRVEFEARLKNP